MKRAAKRAGEHRTGPGGALQPALAATMGCHCLAARRQARAITRTFDAALRPYGVQSTQFSVLAMVALAGPRRTKELAEGLGLERSTLTRSVALLERNGWIGSQPGQDRRERPLHITPAGRRKLAEALPGWQAAQERVGKHLAPREGARRRPPTTRAART
jgi:DNA-binding MarR family transcriptional regulator